MLKANSILFILVAGMFLWSGCSGDSDEKHSDDTKIDSNSIEKKPDAAVHTPEFNADSAYSFIEKQVSFGPRVPGTPAHSFTGQWLIKKLGSYSDTVYLQDTKMIRGEREVSLLNIIGSFNPSAKARVMLAAHWDTRPMADEDADRPTEPNDGANDGASGVGVLLEIARQISVKNPVVGVDIVFFDQEDAGTMEGGTLSWCIGSQYWSKIPHVKDYKARYGILLDMVGAKDAMFPMEGHSANYAGDVLRHVWRTAQNMGYGSHFLNVQGSLITDDHIFMNEGGVPSIDIIHHDFVGGTGFGDFWHTHKDNMSSIHKPTLEMVGLTILQVLYNEK